jgi:IMP dehydrogenase
VAEIEIGIFKSGRRAYGFDDIAIVPSRRTRDPEDVDVSWEIDAYRFDLPLLGAAMDGVISPQTAIELGRLGGLGVLNLEGLWTRYEDPSRLLDEIRELDDEKATGRMQQMYQEPIKPELVTERIRQMKEAGITTSASVTPQRTEALAPAILAAELDLLVIQGTVVSAEHVSKTTEPLNLKRFIREFDIPVVVGGCASVRATPARRAASSVSAFRKRRRSPTSPEPVCAISTRLASTCTSSPTAA